MSELRAFRIVSFAEGGSLLALLFIGMPLKYVLAMPSAVQVLGSLHGVLFLALLSAGLQAVIDGSLSKARALRVLVWSVVPFGFVAIERILRAATSKRNETDR